jgi:hypothetical protein
MYTKTQQVARNLQNLCVLLGEGYVDKNLKGIKNKTLVPFSRRLIVSCEYNEIKTHVKQWINLSTNSTDFYCVENNVCIGATYNNFSKELQVSLYSVFDKSDNFKIEYFKNLRSVEEISK